MAGGFFFSRLYRSYSCLLPLSQLTASPLPSFLLAPLHIAHSSTHSKSLVPRNSLSRTRPLPPPVVTLLLPALGLLPLTSLASSSSPPPRTTNRRTALSSTVAAPINNDNSNNGPIDTHTLSRHRHIIRIATATIDGNSATTTTSGMPSRHSSSHGARLLLPLVLLLSVAGTALAQTPPFFEPSASERLLATFDQNNTDPFFFVLGGVFAVNATQDAPQIYLPANRTTLGPPTNSTLPATYLILMVDPDAPSPQNTSRGEILHWLQPGARLSRSTETQTANDTAISLLSASDTGTEAIVPYQGPAPPSVGPHRYIVLVFRQPDGPANFSLPADYEARRGGQNRTLFNATDFVQKADLGEPVAATFFLAGQQTTGNGSETYNGTDAAAGIGNSSLGGGNATNNSTGGGSGGAGGGTGMTGPGTAPTDSGAQRRERLGLGALIGALAGALWLIG